MNLCSYCNGDGVIKIPGGVAQCPHCGGSCWEPAKTDAQRWRDNHDIICRRLLAMTHERDWWKAAALRLGFKESK